MDDIEDRINYENPEEIQKSIRDEIRGIRMFFTSLIWGGLIYLVWLIGEKVWNWISGY